MLRHFNLVMLFCVEDSTIVLSMVSIKRHMLEELSVLTLYFLTPGNIRVFAETIFAGWPLFELTSLTLFKLFVSKLCPCL